MKQQTVTLMILCSFAIFSVGVLVGMKLSKEHESPVREYSLNEKVIGRTDPEYPFRVEPNKSFVTTGKGELLSYKGVSVGDVWEWCPKNPFSGGCIRSKVIAIKDGYIKYLDLDANIESSSSINLFKHNANKIN